MPQAYSMKYNACAIVKVYMEGKMFEKDKTLA